MLKLTCAVLLMGGAAHTREAARAGCRGSMALGLACAEPLAAPTIDRDPLLAMSSVAAPGPKTVVTPVRVGLLPAPRTLDAALPDPAVLLPADFDALAPAGGDFSTLGLLMAALGVVGYVAHRRSGR